MEPAESHEYRPKPVVIVGGASRSSGPRLLHLLLEQAGFETVTPTTLVAAARAVDDGDRLVVLDLSDEPSSRCLGRAALRRGLRPDLALLGQAADRPLLPAGIPCVVQPFHPLEIVTRLISMLRDRPSAPSCG